MGGGWRSFLKMGGSGPISIGAWRAEREGGGSEHSDSSIR